MAASRSIPINTDINRIFYEYLSLGRSFFEACLSKVNGKKIKLNNKEVLVLSRLMYYNYIIKNGSILSTEIRKNIMKELNIDKYSLNNNIANLRKKKALNDDKIALFLVINPDEDIYRLTFQFNIYG